jgi:hypothetical protein
MACAEVSIPTRDGAACAYSQIQNRATAEHYRPRVRLRATDGTDFSEFAVAAGLRSGRCRDISRSRDALHSPSWRLRTGRGQSRQLHGLLPLADQIHAQGYKSKAPVNCPLWVVSGHFAAQSSCPLYPRKRQDAFFSDVRYGPKADLMLPDWEARLAPTLVGADDANFGTL